jgi:hypothetical protein
VGNVELLLQCVAGEQGVRVVYLRDIGYLSLQVLVEVLEGEVGGVAGLDEQAGAVGHH